MTIIQNFDIQINPSTQDLLSSKIAGRYELLEVAIDLFIEKDKYHLPNTERDYPSSIFMFFASIPHMKTFEIIRNKLSDFEIDFVDGSFRMILKHIDSTYLDIELHFIDTSVQIIKKYKYEDLFKMIEKLWIDLIPILISKYGEKEIRGFIHRREGEIDQWIEKGWV